jgi:hypothetical protein
MGLQWSSSTSKASTRPTLSRFIEITFPIKYIPNDQFSPLQRDLLTKLGVNADSFNKNNTTTETVDKHKHEHKNSSDITLIRQLCKKALWLTKTQYRRRQLSILDWHRMIQCAFEINCVELANYLLQLAIQTRTWTINEQTLLYSVW